MEIPKENGKAYFEIYGRFLKRRIDILYETEKKVEDICRSINNTKKYREIVEYRKSNKYAFRFNEIRKGKELSNKLILK